ncbi:gonadotropin-releasing hormone receptor-like [Solea senegalensis]|uniref:Gonadotropin-releasing hormone receptor-like n=1 Tax=Solea senegalensis TaxID=28829 RepID=A0AAV6RTC8_SOLSE|nr:gonadotropin-releasing hormone receptor [Solea senegalensis]KAG7508732.1 gonadotropin-releasing hormone receptor-like [Solea senegalensis]
MGDYSLNLLGLRVFISCIGLVGNALLILSIIQSRFSRVKSYEFFLLGLAIANLEEIIIMNIYDIVTLETSLTATGSLPCRIFKFLTLFGEIGSILFTVLISIYRYQKLRDANKRVSLPVCLDSFRAAFMVCVLCVMLSGLLSFPIFIINLQGTAGVNATRNKSTCPPDFFQCSKTFCPLINHVYKYVFIMMCNLLPLVIVTITGCLIIVVLLGQRKRVASVSKETSLSQSSKKSKGPGLQRSIIAVLAAMGLFQIDWSIYLILQLSFDHTDYPFLVEVEFFFSTSYTSISPYVYGIGNNLFSLKNFINK